MALRPSRVSFAAVTLSFLVACGGSETIDEPAAGGAGAAGAAGGTAGGSAGVAGSGGAATAGASGGSGAAGKGNAGAGAGGASGTGGTGGGGAGAGGKAGTGGASGGKGGAAGASGGAAGAGAGGAAAACKVDTDCTGQVPVTTPAGCAELFCEPTSGACAVRAKDKDKDGHRGAACKAIDGTSIATGDDCDDNDAETHPGAWDGPADGANPDRCDGKDQNCSNEPDDQKTSAGKSCLCNPGDALVCGEDGGGKTIAFPMLDANGKPVGKCKLGKKTCGGDGKWGPCVGAVPPEKFDICNGGVDDDCDGKADLEDDAAPPNLVTWSYDGDGDGYVDKDDPTVKSSACDDKAPTVCPTSVPSCDLTKWKLGSLPAKDCNDKDGDVNPAGVELCDGVDNDCNGVVDDDYASNASLWYFDWDGDNYGDINTTPKKSCSPPTTFPAGCADLAVNTPTDYCAGVAGEGNPPTCPVPACDVSMWKKNLPNTDCKDRPDQALTGVPKGSNPKLVYPGATDLCNDRDYNCDGSVTTGCGCSPVGATKACGSTQTCNLASQVCVQGGTWDTSQCLPDKPRFDYCPDDDSDGYCDLGKCVTDVCPGDYPQDGHKYRERTTCLGFSTGGSDCSDDPVTDTAAGDINPGLSAEACNGDGKDHNCNGKSNLPGAGDCDCVNGGPIACKAPGHAYPVEPPPDTYPYAADPLLQGICVWDHKSCINGKWTPCSGGTGAHTDGSGQISELCNGDGLDHDCNGKTNKQAGCACQPGETFKCGYTGAEVGICKNGKMDCINGTFANSPCVGAVYPTTRDCASSVDNNCDGSPDNLVDSYCGCAYGTAGSTCGTHAEDGVGTCHAGKRDCVYDGATKRTTWGSCTNSVGPNAAGEGCGPAAADTGCDGKSGNGPGCVKQVHVLVDPLRYEVTGPTSFLLSNYLVEGPYTIEFSMFAYAKQPAGTSGMNWVRVVRCAYPKAGNWDHTMMIDTCTGTGWQYDGLDAYFAMGVAPSPPSYNAISLLRPTQLINEKRRGLFPVTTGAVPAEYYNNYTNYQLMHNAYWTSSVLESTPYVVPGSLNP